MPDPGHGRLRPWARALCVAILTAVYMGAAGGEMPVYEDTIQDMLRARDGMAFGLFEGGSRTTFGEIQQGELWTHFLGGTFSLGLGVLGQQAIAIALAALSVAFFDWSIRRYFGEAAGWESVVVFVPITLVAVVYPIATAGYLAPPALIGSTLALLYVTSSGSTLAAVVCGASLAFAAELHPVTLIGLPIFVLTVWMSCVRPVRALVLGVASGVISALAMSFETWIHNAGAILEEPLLVMLVTAASVVALLVAARGRRWWLALDVARRRFLLLIGIVAGITAELIAASAVVQRMLVMPHYFLFGIPALAVLLGLWLHRLRTLGGWRRLFALALPVVTVSVPVLMAAQWRYGVSTGAVSLPDYSMREAEILAHRFWKKGYSFPDVQRHLRGPESLELMGAIAVFAPNADESPERPLEDVRVIAFTEPYRPKDSLPAGGEEIDLGLGRRAWILPIDGWVRLAPARVCFEATPAAVGKSDCVDVPSESIAYTGLYRDLNERIFPALQHVRDRIDGGSAQVFRWELPIEITGTDQERHFETVGLITVPWMIERVEGVAYRGDLPARSVILERGEGQKGRIVLAPAPSGLTRKPYPPDFLETRPEEAALRRSIRQLPPLGRFVCEAQGTCPGSLDSSEAQASH